jgi:hypothetical protein
VDWVKLSTRYYDDQAVEQLDDSAEVMWTRGLARAGELERGGFIPDSSLPKLTRRRRYAAPARELVAKGLWKRVDGGYQIVNWPRWNDALDELARRRATDRDRQRRWRERARDQRESTMSRDNGNPSRDVTPTEVEGELEGVKEGDTGTTTRLSTTRPPPVENHTKPVPRYCPRHPTGTTAPCGPCKDARLAHDQWRAAKDARIAASPRCDQHTEQPRDHCGPCRSERLAAKDTP